MLFMSIYDKGDCQHITKRPLCIVGLHSADRDESLHKTKTACLPSHPILYNMHMHVAGSIRYHKTTKTAKTTKATEATKTKL